MSILSRIHVSGPSPIGEVSLDLSTGRLTVVYGRNGVGKSRLLNAIVCGARLQRIRGADAWTVMPIREERVLHTTDYRAESLTEAVHDVVDYWLHLLVEGYESTVRHDMILAEHFGANLESDSPEPSASLYPMLRRLVWQSCLLQLRNAPWIDDEAVARAVIDRIQELVDTVARDPRVVFYTGREPAGLCIGFGVDSLPWLGAVARKPWRGDAKSDESSSDTGVGRLPPDLALLREWVSFLRLGTDVALYGEVEMVAPVDDPTATPDPWPTEVVYVVDQDDVEYLEATKRYVMPSGEEFDWESMRTTAQELENRANQTLRLLLPHPPELALDLAPVSSWAWGPPVKWQALTPNGSVVQISELSSAEARWSAFAIWLSTLLGDPAKAGPLVVVDEPERGLFRTAEDYLARGLHDLAKQHNLAILAASHSPPFIGTRGVSALHLSRNDAGDSDLVKLDGWREETRADELGIPRGEQLRHVTAWLLVEGEHDRTVLDVFIGSELREWGVMILTLGGTRSLHAALDAQLLFSLNQDACVIACLDAVDGPEFLTSWDAAKTAWRESRQLGRKVLDEARQQATSYELRELVKFSRAVLEAGMEDRILPFGLSHRDICDYVDPTPWGVSSWAELRSRFLSEAGSSSKGETSFKQWLKDTTGQPVSVRTLRMAAERTDELHSDIAKLRTIVHANSQGQRRS